MITIFPLFFLQHVITLKLYYCIDIADGSVDAVLAGLVGESALAFDRHATLEVQGRLFRGASPFGLDLIAIDIQRGRDHGKTTVEPGISFDRGLERVTYCAFRFGNVQ